MEITKIRKVAFFRLFFSEKGIFVFLLLDSSRLGRLVLPAQNSPHILFSGRGNQSGRRLAGVDPSGICKQAFISRLDVHAYRMTLRSGSPHQSDAPGFFAGAEKQVDLNPSV